MSSGRRAGARDMARMGRSSETPIALASGLLGLVVGGNWEKLLSAFLERLVWLSDNTFAHGFDDTS